MSADAAIVLLPQDGRAEDASLVGRARAGDRFAEELLYRRHVRDVTRIATRLLGRTAEADDIVQDAFLTAFRQIGRLRDERLFGGWLARITLNLARSRLRRRRLWRMVGIDGDDDASLMQLASPGLDPEQRADLALIDDCLATLPAEPRMAWLLRHVEGWGLEEIAAGLGRSLATVKRRLQAAEQAIARRIP
jgi:RNA polymerase sigma-70 factor (ECF subfamily)